MQAPAVTSPERQAPADLSSIRTIDASSSRLAMECFVGTYLGDR
ncbi:hypothetical protein ACWKW1_07715 [Brevibacillus parabrevis]